MKTLVISAILLVCIDAMYLTLIKDYFNNQIKQVQGSAIQLNWMGAILTYMFLVGGLYYFILRNRKSVFDAFLLGIVIYGVYEYTNLSLLKNWRVLTTILDTLWGGILFALTTFIVYKLK
jgi:uncharacterized membrane protein